MKNTVKVIFALVLALCLSVVVFSACNTAETGYGRIKGVVVDADGDPLEDATVVVVGNEDIIAETNERGAFTLRNVEIKDDITLEVTLQGYEKQQVKVNKADFENEVATPTVTLTVGKGTVSGYVFSAANPDVRLEGARVSVDGKSATTDANGAYTVEDVTMLRSQRITVTLNGFTEGGKTITVRSYNSECKASVNIGLSPLPVTVKGYKNKDGGNINMAIPQKLALQSSYDVNALKTGWNIDGAASQIAEGISLNAKDPWNAKNLENSDKTVINAYMYIYTDITAENANMAVSCGIVKYADTRDGDRGNFLPYIKVLVLDKDGNEISAFDWTQVTDPEGLDNYYTTTDYDLTSCIGQDRFIVIACNVGYRATVNSITFTE